MLPLAICPPRLPGVVQGLGISRTAIRPGAPGQCLLTHLSLHRPVVLSCSLIFFFSPLMAALRKISTWTFPDAVTRTLALGLLIRSFPVGSSIHMGMTFPSNSCMVRGLVPLSWYHMCRSGMIRPKNPSPQKGVILLAPPPVSLGAIPLASAAAYRAIRWESAAESPGTLMIIRSGREESSFSGTSVSAIGVLRVSRECLAGVDDFSARAGESVLLQKEGASDVLVMAFVLRHPDPVDEDVLQDAGNRGNHVGHTGGVLQRPVVEVVAHLVGVVVGGAEPCSQGRGTGLAQLVPRPVGAKEIVARPDLEVVGGLEGDLLGVTHTSGSEGVLPVPVRNDAGTDDQRPVSPSEVRSEAVRTLVSPRL